MLVLRPNIREIPELICFCVQDPYVYVVLSGPESLVPKDPIPLTSTGPKTSYCKAFGVLGWKDLNVEEPQDLIFWRSFGC